MFVSACAGIQVLRCRRNHHNMLSGSQLIWDIAGEFGEFHRFRRSHGVQILVCACVCVRVRALRGRGSTSIVEAPINALEYGVWASAPVLLPTGWPRGLGRCQACDRGRHQAEEIHVFVIHPNEPHAFVWSYALSNALTDAVRWRTMGYSCCNV